jgi:hypothetical protein
MRGIICALLLTACATPTRTTTVAQPSLQWKDILVTCQAPAPDHLPTWKRWTWWTFLAGSLTAVALGAGLGVGLSGGDGVKLSNNSAALAR